MDQSKLFDLYLEKLEWTEDVLTEEERLALKRLISLGIYDQKHFLRSLPHDIFEELEKEIENPTYLTYTSGSTAGSPFVHIELDLSL